MATKYSSLVTLKAWATVSITMAHVWVRGLPLASLKNFLDSIRSANNFSNHYHASERHLKQDKRSLGYDGRELIFFVWVRPGTHPATSFQNASVSDNKIGGCEAEQTAQPSCHAKHSAHRVTSVSTNRYRRIGLNRTR